MSLIIFYEEKILCFNEKFAKKKFITTDFRKNVYLVSNDTGTNAICNLFRINPNPPFSGDGGRLKPMQYAHKLSLCKLFTFLLQVITLMDPKRD